MLLSGTLLFWDTDPREIESTPITVAVTPRTTQPIEVEPATELPSAVEVIVAEVEELVPVGTLDPNHIHIPGIFIQRIFQGENYEKRIEQLTVRKQN